MEKRNKGLIEALYNLAAQYQNEAEEACKRMDTGRVHNCVREARVAMNKARKLELYDLI